MYKRQILKGLKKVRIKCAFGDVVEHLDFLVHVALPDDATIALGLSLIHILKIDPSNIEAYMGRAEAYKGLKQYDDAKADYTEVIGKTDEMPYTCLLYTSDMTIQVSYKVRLLFYIEMFHFGEFESTQTVCCRLWK